MYDLLIMVLFVLMVALPAGPSQGQAKQMLEDGYRHCSGRRCITVLPEKACMKIAVEDGYQYLGDLAAPYEGAVEEEIKPDCRDARKCATSGMGICFAQGSRLVVVSYVESDEGEGVCTVVCKNGYVPTATTCLIVQQWEDYGPCSPDMCNPCWGDARPQDCCVWHPELCSMTEPDLGDVQ